MDTWDSIIKAARESHTKQAWEQLFATHRQTIAAAGLAKPLGELFRILKQDPQCHLYDPMIWEVILQGCLSSWNMDLGREIADFARRTHSSAVAILSARVHMESGHPQHARELAQRALRHAGIQPWERLQLEMLICGSYVEEGKHAPAIRLLTRITNMMRASDVADKDRADFVINMARTHYFLGRYQQASKLFYEAYQLYTQLQDWDNAAKAVFNTAACNHNTGGKMREAAFAMVEECRRIAETHNLPGPLAHCNAFYGTDDYQHGNFAGAREHFRAALEHLPASDKSFRRLHILSMLAFTYLRTGRFQPAKKFAQQTFDLAALDESDRFKSRYDHLKAEILWGDGEVEASQELLNKTTASMVTRGVHTLEELSGLSRHYLQSAYLHEENVAPRVKIDDSLKKNTEAWFEFLYAHGQMALTQRRYDDALDIFENSLLTKARQYGDQHSTSLALLGITQAKLASQQPIEAIEPIFREFEVATARMVETPVKASVQIVLASIAYRQGHFKDCERYLRAASRLPYLGFVDRFVVECWIATIEGRSCRLVRPWQQELLARQTRLYFAPKIEAISEREFRVSDHYLVNLEKHPALADLLRHLLTRTNFSAAAGEIQAEVWQQSLAQQGWQQKIRNTIMRLRDFFPQTMAPLIIHTDQIRLFREAIEVVAYRSLDLSPEQEIIRLLRDGPLSSVQLSNRLSVSAATTKRLLKKLTDNRNITVMKLGRQVFYQALDQQQSQ